MLHLLAVIGVNKWKYVDFIIFHQLCTKNTSSSFTGVLYKRHHFGELENAYIILWQIYSRHCVLAVAKCGL